MLDCQVRDLGLMRYADAWDIQQRLVENRKSGRCGDQLLLVEHPHVITMGRNGRIENLLAGEDLLARAGIEFQYANRGGDVTYHGPGQLVAYPILDLKQWKRDVAAYVRALEQVVIGTLAGYGLGAGREPGATGVWVDGAKICAIGVHLSRWVTSHGLALNIETELSYFRYIIPCGLTRPVTSLRTLGIDASRQDVMRRLVRQFGIVFERQMQAPASWQWEPVSVERNQ